MAKGVRRILTGLECAGWLAVAGVLLHFVPFERLFRALPPGSSAGTPDDRDRQAVERIRGAVNAVAAHLPWHPRCLPRAFAGLLMCRVRRMQVPIALSVTARGGFDAHARLDPGSDAELSLAAPEGRTHLGRVILTF